MADEKSKKGKKCSISEEDVSVILERYSPETVLTLLHEVAKVATRKIDCNALVKKTATGISSAREYQMLWRHLAYQAGLDDDVASDEEPLDDDSDLEYELEASPPLSRESATEAAACVKVLMASAIHDGSSTPDSGTIVAPLIINIPDANAVGGSKDIFIPVCIPKLQPVSSGEKRSNIETSGSEMPPRRKRRSWSAEEDAKLTAAVEKHGERNWAHISREDFINERKPHELSQRWANLRKKQSSSKAVTSSQLSENQLAAAHRAMSLALDMPMGDSSKAARQINRGSPKIQGGPQMKAAAPSPDPLVKAAAVAAGARIATPAHASSLMEEAARSQNVLHIKTGSSCSASSSVAALSKLSLSPTMTNQLPNNVHFIRDGLAKAPISAYSANQANVDRVPPHSKDSAVQPKSVCSSQRKSDIFSNNPVVGQAEAGDPSQDIFEKHPSSASPGSFSPSLMETDEPDRD